MKVHITFLIFCWSSELRMAVSNVTLPIEYEVQRQRRQLFPGAVVVSGAMNSVPCITCTYANRAGCCTYYNRCCGAIAPNIPQTPTPGVCPPSASSLYACSQTCLTDQECTQGYKCCPPPPTVCVIPFAGSQCPLSVPAEAYLRPCYGLAQQTIGGTVTNCETNEFCCPNPYAKGCCMPASAISNPNLPVTVG